MVEEVEVDGHLVWWHSHAAVPSPEHPAESVRLMPHLDCYGLGCHARGQLVPREWHARALVAGAIGPVPVPLVDGIVAGTWTQPSGPRTAFYGAHRTIGIKSSRVSSYDWLSAYALGPLGLATAGLVAERIDAG
ncbi:MAG: DNA glycosylase AlkZ-like family protein [Chloroflexota bacterium]